MCWNLSNGSNCEKALLGLRNGRWSVTYSIKEMAAMLWDVILFLGYLQKILTIFFFNRIFVSSFIFLCFVKIGYSCAQTSALLPSSFWFVSNLPIRLEYATAFLHWRSCTLLMSPWETRHSPHWELPAAAAMVHGSTKSYNISLGCLLLHSPK